MTSIEQVNHNVTTVTNSAIKQATVSNKVNQSTKNLTELFVNELEHVSNLKQEVLQLNQLADELNRQLRLFKMS